MAVSGHDIPVQRIWRVYEARHKPDALKFSNVGKFASPKIVYKSYYYATNLVLSCSVCSNRGAKKVGLDGYVQVLIYRHQPSPTVINPR